MSVEQEQAAEIGRFYADSVGIGERTLSELESVIEAGVQTFVEVGRALMEIRDRRLYREQGRATFEAYCQERWGWSRAHAYRQIDAAKVAANLSPIGDTPRNEAQARELAALPAEEQRAVAAEVDFQESTAAEVRQAVQRAQGAHVAHNSGESEWYTPAEIIALARQVLGGIDLDPATHADAQAVVSATTFYTAGDDGLKQPWRGRVWLNPPYSQPAVGRFCEKLLEEIGAGRIEAAITLTNNATETEWGQLLLGACNAACFPRGRVRFWAPGRISCSPLQGQMLCYFGSAPEAFVEKFHSLGACLNRAR